MKKFLITIFPILIVLFIIIWIPFGLECAVVYIGVVLSILIFGALSIKWAEFVDKHIKD